MVTNDVVARAHPGRGTAPATQIPAQPAGAVAKTRPSLSARLEDACLAACMAAMAAITFANVLARYFTDASFAFTEEYTVVLLTIMSLLGAAAAVRGNRHIRMSFFADRLPERWRTRLEAAVMLSVAVVFLLLAVYGTRASYNEYRYEEVSPGLGQPAWIYSMWVPLISLLIAVRAVGRALRVRRCNAE
ncbi:hypothetical protein BWR60_28310 [Inquilinus limosus]|uniref:TRAP transporter small permease protein n=2 Tax=Inquilinus limosus TaxID=171674 RepID=A0A211ZET8_9PROT|nr:hypothetical protein BWR60_28310 [Inquilinus limosus]